jgi:hypothetical protein
MHLTDGLSRLLPDATHLDSSPLDCENAAASILTPEQTYN